MKPLNELRKRPYTSDELFDNIVRILRENHDLPCILDYSTAVSRSNNHEIQTDEFDIMCDLGFGGSEGIYLTVFIRLYDASNTIHIGTFKTLYESKDALRTMAILEADVIWHTRQFVSEHSDDFIWTGYSVFFFKTDGSEPCFHFSSRTKDSAMEHIQTFLPGEEYDHAVLRDNVNKTDTVIRKEEFL